MWTFGRAAGPADNVRMAPATGSVCASCGRPDEAGTLICGLCGHLLRRAPTARLVVPDVAPEVGGADDHAESAETRAARTATARTARVEPWFFLGLGLLTAPVFALPFVGFMGWFLGSLVHEMGHSALSWLCGMPSVPAIALDGHAAAVHGEQMLFLVALIAIGFASSLWKLFEGRVRVVLLVAFGVIYPALAFTGLRELAFLLAGHFGELAFATLCLFKALDGGFTDSHLERALYGTLGWFLLGKNLFLTGGLMFSAVSRAEYAANGSFGLTNDYIRVARDVLGSPVQMVAFGMTLVALCVLPCALWLWRVSLRADD